MHLVADSVHKDFGPVVVIVAGTAGNLKQAVAIILAAIGLITAIEVGIILGAHVAATSPALVTYTDILHLPGLFTTILLAQLGHRTILRCHILYPLGGLLYRAATHVHRHVRLASEEFAQIEELMCTEGVIL